jgi:phospholipid transport system substrate-binding protein
MPLIGARACGIPAALAWALLLAGPAVAVEGSATAVVEELHVHMMAVMKESARQSFDQRFSSLEAPIARAFDLEFMAIRSLGPRYRELSKTQRARWVDSFRRFTVASHARRLTNYEGERFETESEVPASRGGAIVRTRLVHADGFSVPLGYRMRRTDDGWKIIDVYLHGVVSELAIRRDEFSSFYKREGIEALIASVNQRATGE